MPDEPKYAFFGYLPDTIPEDAYHSAEEWEANIDALKTNAAKIKPRADRGDGNDDLRVRSLDHNAIWAKWNELTPRANAHRATAGDAADQ